MSDTDTTVNQRLEGAALAAATAAAGLPWSPGMTTSEFKVLLSTPVLSVIMPLITHYVVPVLPPWVAAVLTVAANVAYMISRGLTKLGFGKAASAAATSTK